MPVELICVGLAALLVIAQVLVAAVPRALVAPGWAAGARDAPPPAMPDRVLRADRARANMLETFPVFAAAAIGVVAGDATTSLTALGAQLYLVARFLYLPAYVFHVPMVRSLIWVASLVGILLVLSPYVTAVIGGDGPVPA